MGRVHWMPAVVLGLAATLIVPVAIIAASSRTSHDRTLELAQPASSLTVSDDDSQQSEEARRQAAEEIRKAEQLLRAKLAEIERELAQLARRSAEAQLESKQKVTEVLKEKHEAILKDHEKVKRQHEAELLQHLKGKGDAKVVEAHKQLLDHAGAQHAREMALAAKQLDAVKRLHEQGLVGKNELHDVEAALAQARAHGNTMPAREAELKQLAQQLERARTMVDRGLMPKRELTELQDELAALRAHLSQARQVDEAARQVQQATRSQQAADELHRAKIAEQLTKDVKAANAQELRKLLDERKVRIADLAMDDMPRGAEVAQSDREPARAGDVIRITISGEPDLPTRFAVTPSGSIRIPFLGSFKALGQTSAQIREAVGDQLESRRLGNASQVRVTVLRGGKVDEVKRAK